MKTRKTIFFAFFFGILIFVGIGLFKPDILDTVLPADAVASTQMRSLQLKQKGKVFICYHDIYTLEQRVDSTAIQIGNFPVVWDVDTSMVSREKPFRTPLPGKGEFPKDKLLKIVPPEGDNEAVLYILESRRLKETCQMYEFSQLPG